MVIKGVPTPSLTRPDRLDIWICVPRYILLIVLILLAVFKHLADVFVKAVNCLSLGIVKAFFYPHESKTEMQTHQISQSVLT